MKTHKPLTDEDGEVRELLMEDIKRFRPIAEGISPTLAAKLGLKRARDKVKRSETQGGLPRGKQMGKLEAILPGAAGEAPGR